MQSNKLRKGIIGLGLGLLGSYAAEASLLTPVDVNFNNQSTANIIAQVGSSLAGPGETVINLLRLDDLASPGSGTGFTITYGSTGSATISWNLAGKGTELEGVYIFGGSAANLYKVTTDGELTGSGSIITPLNHGGQIPGISHILFLGAKDGIPVPSVPDAANTSILLGASLLGISFIRNRFFKHKQ